MRIEHAGGLHRRLAARPRAGQASFSMPAEGAEPAQETQAAAPAAVLTPLATLTEAAPHTDSQTNQVAVEHGRAMLDALARLQMAALAPDDGQARTMLAALAKGMQQAADPRLNDVLQAIAARAAVALARSGDGPT